MEEIEEGAVKNYPLQPHEISISKRDGV